MSFFGDGHDALCFTGERDLTMFKNIILNLVAFSIIISVTAFSVEVADFMINEGASQNFPVITSVADGSSLALWIDFRESAGGDIYGQRFDSLGNFAGVNFKVNDAISGEGNCSQLSLSSNGVDRAIAVWTDGATVVYQALDYPNFTKTGDNMAATDVGYNYNSFFSDVGVASDKTFVIVWRRRNAEANDNTNSYMRRFGANLLPTSQESQLNDWNGLDIANGLESLLYHHAPRIAMQPDGQFAVAWIEQRIYQEMGVVSIQLYDAAGSGIGFNKIVTDFEIRIAASSDETIPPDIIANINGDYAVAWTGVTGEATAGLWARTYDETANPLSSAFRYSDDFTQSTDMSASLIAGPDDNFMGVYYNAGSDDENIFVQKFDVSGKLIGSPERVDNDLSGAKQSYPTATVAGDEIHFVWEDFRNDSGNSDIFARIANWYSFSAPCGDINGDGNPTNVLDLTYAVDFIFRGGPLPDYIPAADLDGSGEFNILDLTFIVDFIFRGGPAPAC